MPRRSSTFSSSSAPQYHHSPPPPPPPPPPPTATHLVSNPPYALDLSLAHTLLPAPTYTSAFTTWLPHTTAIAPLRLGPPREESTRIQLQRQHLRQHHVTAIVSNSIPGFKTSAAFFASLRTNLRLHACPPPSPIGTPPSMRGSASSLPPPSPLSQPTDLAMADTDAPVPASDPLSGVPDLQTYLAESEEEKVAAMKLAADSVAQMRQTANSSLIFHQYNTPVAFVLMAVLGQYMHEKKFDWVYIASTMMGVLMALFATCRWFTKDYLFAAEDINWAWLGDADIIVTKFGDEVIGTVMIEWVSGEARQKRKKAWRGEIKAWTVRLRYRGKGVGSSLLEEAIKEAQRKGAETLEFAEVHANSKRILPDIYNHPFDKREKKSRALLQDLLDANSRGGKRK